MDTNKPRIKVANQLTNRGWTRIYADNLDGKSEGQILLEPIRVNPCSSAVGSSVIRVPSRPFAVFFVCIRGSSFKVVRAWR